MRRMILLLSLACAACTARTGPIVRDVFSTPDGKLFVERCDLVLYYTGYVPAPSLDKCITSPVTASAIPRAR